MSDKRICISWLHQACHHNRQVCACYICGDRSDCILIDRNHFAPVASTNVEDLNTPRFTLEEENGGSSEPILDGSGFTWTGSHNDYEPIWHINTSPNAQVFDPLSPNEHGSPDLERPTRHNTDNNTSSGLTPLQGTAIQQTKIGTPRPDSRTPPNNSADQHQQPTNEIGIINGNTGHTTSIGELDNNQNSNTKISSGQSNSIVFDNDEVIDVCTKAARIIRNLEENSDDRTILETMLEEIYLYEERKSSPMEVVEQPVRQKKPRTIFIRLKTTPRNVSGIPSSSTATTSTETGVQTLTAHASNQIASSPTTRTTSTSPSRADSPTLTSIRLEPLPPKEKA